jgi:hypothetical protein
MSSTEIPDSDANADYTVFANPTEVVHHLAVGRCRDRDNYTPAEYLRAMETVKIEYPRLFALAQSPGARQAELMQATQRYRREGLMP